VLLSRHVLTLFLRYPNPPSLLHIIKRMVFFFWRLDYSKISSSVHALSRNKQYSSLKHRHSTVRLHTILPPTTPPDHASIQSHPTHSKHHPHQPKINRLPIVPTGTCPDSQREKPCIPEIHRSASHAGDTGWVASARYCACSEAHTARARAVPRGIPATRGHVLFVCAVFVLRGIGGGVGVAKARLIQACVSVKGSGQV
jgi:hypothetical protein